MIRYYAHMAVMFVALMGAIWGPILLWQFVLAPARDLAPGWDTATLQQQELSDR